MKIVQILIENATFKKNREILVHLKNIESPVSIYYMGKWF